ncbi:PorP/SprF family type IX secretion system membrane protein [Imtechella halotolerans]|nr:type IX secretion system membrane protein PorP/SprF [Imtechella halotolerans]WMQ63257.1 type IX secretion system membrane protein PorP/SprF [Imtechella halotolerans]
MKNSGFVRWYQQIKQLLVFSVLMVILLFSSKSLAQEGIPVYFDYLTDNYYLIHPSMAGAGDGGKIRLTARKQWFGVDDAPALQTLSANMRLAERSGIGMIAFNDKNGYHSQSGGKITYAHHINLGSGNLLNQLSFGMSAGFIQSRLDESEFLATGIYDPNIHGGLGNASYFNVDFGVSYHIGEVFTHLTVKNALGSERNLYTAAEFDNLRRYLVSLGLVIDGNEWQYEPSVMFQLSEFTKEKSIDVNAKVYRDVSFGKIFGGLSYRRSFDGAQYIDNGEVKSQKLNLVSPIIGINYKNFLFAYTYTNQGGDMRYDNGGFHQITLGFDFLQSGRRWDCYCPAVNY